MLFVEPFFLFVLLPATICAFYFMGLYAGRTATLAVVVIASAIFYAPYGVLPAILLATSLCINLFLGIKLSKDDFDDKRQRKTLLAIGLVLNFAALGTFKYLDQLAAMIVPSAGPILGIAIPAGISFYTFHQAVFLQHAYNRNVEVVSFFKGAKSILGKLAVLIRYSAFVAFFPQLITGPITYMSEFGPQVQGRSFGRLRVYNLQIGVTLIVVGLFKKLCIADVLAYGVNPIYDEISAGTPILPRHAIFAIVGYFFQLYYDFSGYADISLGIARLCGLRLPINFDSPLRAIGIVDYYRRWHITLTRAIVLFVFTPLSLWGTRVAIERGYKGWRRRAIGTWLPLVANFQLIALWHAAKGTFVLFGTIHGLWYVLETEIRASGTFKAFRSRTSERFRTIAGMAITAPPLMLTFALFRSENLNGFFSLLSALVGFASPPPPPYEPIDPRELLAIVVAAVIVYLLPNVYELLRRYRPGFVTYPNPSMTPPILRFMWRPNLMWALFVAILTIAILTRINHPTPFLYAKF